MSRTDHHRPSWVRSNDPLEDRRVIHTCVRYRGFSECTGPEPAIRHPYRHYNRRICYYWVIQHAVGSPPNEFVTQDYHSPMRRDARDTLRAAAKEWNGSGDTGLEPFNRQARRSAQWNWC